MPKAIVASPIVAPDGQALELPARLLTVPLLEKAHPGVAGRVRGWIVRADLNDSDYAGLRDAVVRIGRSVYIDEPRFLGWITTRRGAAPERPRNPHGRAGKRPR